MTLHLPDETEPPTASPDSDMDGSPNPPAAPSATADPVPAGPLVAALAGALDKIAAAAGEPDPVEMVHDARKAMKEYRALLRLIPGREARAARQETATAARDLASARDHTAALEALSALHEARRIGAGDFKAAQALIGAEAPPPDTLATCREALDSFVVTARARLATGLAAAAVAADLAEGLAQAYRRARRGRFGDAEAVHETRKDVVTHRYQMSFVAARFGGRGARRAVRAQALRDLLGAHQDMEILRPLVKEIASGLGPPATKRVENAVKRQQKELRRTARRLHAKLFRRKPKAFARAYRDVVARGTRRGGDGGPAAESPPG